MRAPSLLEDAIFRTISWFSLFSYPLTAFEIWKWMDTPPAGATPGAVFSCLNTSVWLEERLVRADGFFARRDGSAIGELVAMRQERFADAMRKMKKLKRAVRYIALAPFVRGVFAANTLSWWHTREDSDLDLLIIVEPGSIWASRFLIVLPFLLFGARPAEGKSVRDPFCFSFFATTHALDVSSLQLAGGDPYLAYWTRALIPVLDRGIATQVHASNAWAKGRLPHAPGRATHPALARSRAFALPCHAYWAERLYRRIQLRRLPAHIRAMMNQDTRVVVTEDVLKFHDTDRREEYRNRFYAIASSPSAPRNDIYAHS